MQGFNRYYPPDYDPKENPTLNSISGKHALGDRARKLGEGILIVRFELPFNIWCGGCKNHIGQGVRYNAEKRKVGNYYSTPIFAFRCKCHLCSHWFEIATDPQNTCYTITEGARQRIEDFDAAEAGTLVLDQKDPDKPVDAMAAAEKQTIDKQVAETSKSRIQALASLQEDRWSDPYILSKRLRKSHREEKRVIQARDESDSALRSKLSLPQDLDLEEDNEQFKLEAQKEWRDAKSQASTSVRDEDSRKRRRSEIVQSSITDVPREPTSSSKKKRARVSHPAPSIPKEPKSTARDLLASRLAQQTRRASAGSSGVFDGPSSRSSSRSVRASLKGLSRLVRSSR